MKWLLAVALVFSVNLVVADEKELVTEYLDKQQGKHAATALRLWDLAGLPTAFVASYGQGKLVIGVLAEFDALPGISQSASPVREPLADKPNGHACGHHLFGVGSVAATLAVKYWMDKHDVKGTVRLYGTPAEEGGSGKVYMVRAGLFSDVDAVLHWHPSDRNAANPATSLANKSARFTFTGISAHVAATPHLGRSALDGVEAMNYMVNLMREHVPQESRMHYVITQGGDAPNVVPDHAQVYYYIRHPNAQTLLTIWDRVIATAQAATQGTGTEVDIEVMHGNHSLLPNEVLAQVMHANLVRVGVSATPRKSMNLRSRLAAHSLKPLTTRVLKVRSCPWSWKRGGARPMSVT